MKQIKEREKSLFLDKFICLCKRQGIESFFSIPTLTL